MRPALIAVNLLFLWAFLSMQGAAAQEVSIAAGGLDATSVDQTTYSWALEYRQVLQGSLAASFTWLNEGHVTDHHRDGQAAQLWWQSAPQGATGANISLGLGPYGWYDTTRTAPDTRFQDAHGWGVLGSAEAAWYFSDGWIASLRLNAIAAHRSFDSYALLAGLGYRFGDGATATADSSGPWSRPWPWEVQGFLGQSTENSFRSQSSAVEALGVRTDLSEHLAASLGYRNTGLRSIGWSTATTAQGWLGTSLTRDIRVEVGLGALIPVDLESRLGHPASGAPSALVAVGGAYQLSSRWVARLVWDRVGTGDSHDADLLIFGVGYRF